MQHIQTIKAHQVPVLPGVACIHLSLLDALFIFQES
jgi:hypothetical protein